MKKEGILKSILAVLTSNFSVLCLGVLIALYLPLVLDIKGYGYFQLYLLYSSYLGIFTYGMLDGINLKFAGIEYKFLDKKLMSRYLSVLILMCSSVVTIVLFFLYNLNISYNEKIVYTFICLNILTFNINGYFTHLNQLSLRFKEYSMGLVIERIFFIISFLPIFLINNSNFVIYIIANFVCRIITITYNIYTSKEIVKLISFKNLINKNEIFEVIKIGYPVMLSGFLSLLIIGAPRFYIEYFFGIEEFGLFSFSMSILSIGVQVILALSSVIYPVMRKINKNLYNQINITLSNIVTWVGILALLFYYVIYYIISCYLIKYSEILNYLYLLFPFMIYQCRYNITISMFYKVLRFEKELLKNYIMGLMVCTLSLMICLILKKDIFYTIFSFVLAYAIWVYLSIYRMSKLTNWDIKRNEKSEILVILIFLISNTFFSIQIGFCIYILSILVHLIKNYYYYKQDIKFIKNLY